MKNRGTAFNKKYKTGLKIKQRKKQRAFINKALSYNTLKKRYEKFKLQSRNKQRLPKE